MDKKISDIDFSDIDFSKYDTEIKEIQKTYDNLKSNKKFMKRFNIFLKKGLESKYSVYYNQLPANQRQFKQNPSIVSTINNKNNCDNYYQTKGNLSLYS